MVQSQHSIADFAAEFPEQFRSWKKESNSIVSLSVNSEESLLKLYDKLSKKSSAILFREPDIDDQATSFCILGTPEIRKKLSYLPLSLKSKNKRTLEQVTSDMKNCEQMKGLSVYEHGEMVRDYFLDLYNYLNGESLKYTWKLPDWLESNKEFILNEINKFDLNQISTYHLYHDCGKPYCKTIDEEGKQHFPDHANVSHKVWTELGGDEFVGTLIQQDMDIHLLKAEGLEEFCNRPHAVVLLLTGLAEIHANATLFGGIESTSFKIKWKHIDKRGKAIIKNLNEKQNEK